MDDDFDFDMDLGHEHYARKFGWHPDRELNPQYEGIPDQDFAGLIVRHPKLNAPGEFCTSGINIQTMKGVLPPEHPVWDLISEDPLHVEPSLLCRLCGDHGFIRNGLWVPC